VEENLEWVVTSEYELAVARLLGRDAGRMMTPGTRQVLLDILEEESREDGQLRLVSDMLTGSAHDADFILAQIQQFRQGIIDVAVLT
jgi:predicted nucleotidyltransferase